MLTHLPASYGQQGNAQQKLERLPNTCLLIAIQAKAAMSEGDIIIAWWEIPIAGTTIKKGHAWYRLEFGDYWLLYDIQGSRIFPKAVGLHLIMGLHAKAAGAINWGYKPIRYAN